MIWLSQVDAPITTITDDVETHITFWHSCILYQVLVGPVYLQRIKVACLKEIMVTSMVKKEKNFIHFTTITHGYE